MAQSQTGSVLVLAAIIGGLVVWARCSDLPDLPAPPLPAVRAPAPPKPVLNARVIRTLDGFEVHNDDDFGWESCTFEINLRAGRTGFLLERMHLHAHSWITVNAAEFADRDGARFDPAGSKLAAFFVDCDTPAGRGSWGGGAK